MRTSSTSATKLTQAVAVAERDDLDYSTRSAAVRPYLMTHSEAFVETMVAHGVDTTFGIVGSAFMDALDLFPSAGIRFVSVQHEQGGARFNTVALSSHYVARLLF